MSLPIPTPFSAAHEWASAYRACGLCVVPAIVKSPKEKHPIGSWRSLIENGMTPQEFDDLYGPNGTHRTHMTMGFVTGMASRVTADMGLVVIDIDVKDGVNGDVTWRAWLAEAQDKGHDTDMETWTAKTGSDGLHLYFALSKGRMLANSQAKLDGIDVRAQGGFVMGPPSPHYIQGKSYEWIAPPWETPIQIMPDWLWQKLVDMGVAPGQFNEGVTPVSPSQDTPVSRSGPVQTPQPTSQRNAFGLLIDGRQKHMADVSFVVVTDHYRESPIRPAEAKWEEIVANAYKVYSMGVDTRLQGVSKFEGLEKEGRGYSAMRERVHAHMRAWDTTIKNAASKPKAGDFGQSRSGEQAAATGPFAAQAAVQFQEAESLPFKATTLTGKAPERQWLWKDWIPANAVTSLYGDGGVGKTLLAQQLAYAAGAGFEFMGATMPKIGVVGAFCEDDRDELHRRHEDIVRANGGIAAPFENVWLWPRVGYDNILVNFDRNHQPTLSPFFAHLCDQITKIRPGLVILDTAADLFGGNEIVRFEANYFIKSVAGQLIKMAQLRGDMMSVLILAHPSQSGKSSGSGESGSTGWNNAVRSRLYLRRPLPEEGMAGDMRVLTRMKSNYSAAGDGNNLHLMWEDGILKVIGGAAANLGGDHDRKVERVKDEALGMVKAAWSSGNPFKERKGHPHEIFAALIGKLGIHGYSKTEVTEAVHQLIHNGDIVVGRTPTMRGFKGDGQ